MKAVKVFNTGIWTSARFAIGVDRLNDDEENF
jgi:hypothetical protein